jgi:hypothetical protein
MFDITTSWDFFQKLEADFDDYMKEPHSARLALNCAITAYHLCEWVWGDWLNTDYATWQQLKIRDLESFKRWIFDVCPWFDTIENLANGAKHFRTLHFTTARVGAPPFMLDEPLAGFDEGAWDEPMPLAAINENALDDEASDEVVPFVAHDGKGYLLIDYGPGTGPHRWKTALALLHVVLRFWRHFLAQYHPDLQKRAKVRDWRL